MTPDEEGPINGPPVKEETMKMARDAQDPEVPLEDGVLGMQGQMPPSTPDPQATQRVHTKDGVKFMLFGLVFLALSLLMAVVVSLYSASIYEDLIRNLLDPKTKQAFVRLGTMAAIGLVFRVISLVAIIASIYFFHKGKEEVSNVHSENMRWAIIFLVGYTIAFLAPFAFNNPSGELVALRVGLSAIFGFLDNFFFAFLLLYLVKDLAGPRERDLLYLFAGLYIIFPFLSYLVPHATIGMVDPFEMIKRVFMISAALAVLQMLVVGLAAFAYWYIKKDMDMHGLALPKARPAFLPRPRPLDSYIGKFYSTPKVSLTVMLVLGLIFGAAIGGGAYHPKTTNGGGGGGPEEPDVPVQEMYLAGAEGSLQEGDSEVYGPNELGGDVIFLEVVLTWEDEGDYTLRTNQPDGFTLEVSLDGETREASGENTRNGEGQLVLTFDYGEEDPLYVEEYQIVVTLDYAGDQEGPIGVGGPLTVTDDSNDYTVELVYVYLV